MVGVPIFAEQIHNAFRIQDRGFGLSMLPGGLTVFEVDDLVSALKEVARNPKYKAAVQKASDILKDSPMTPTETTTYWIEHVMKFGGEHLRSYGMELPGYQFFMLDILLFVAVIAHVIAFVLFVILGKIFRMVLGSKKTKTD